MDFKYRRSSTNNNSTLKLRQLIVKEGHGSKNPPFFGHHEDALNQQAFQNLGPNSLKQAGYTLMFDDELQYLNEALKWQAISGWRWLGL